MVLLVKGTRRCTATWQAPGPAGVTSHRVSTCAAHPARPGSGWNGPLACHRQDPWEQKPPCCAVPAPPSCMLRFALKTWQARAWSGALASRKKLACPAALARLN